MFRVTNQNRRKILQSKVGTQHTTETSATLREGSRIRVSSGYILLHNFWLPFLVSENETILYHVIFWQTSSKRPKNGIQIYNDGIDDRTLMIGQKSLEKKTCPTRHDSL